MENNTSILGINKRVIVFVHKLLLIVMLHSTFVAPSQIMLDDYFKKSKPIKYFGSYNSTPETETSVSNPDVLQHDEGKHKKGASLQTINVTPTPSASFTVEADIKEGIIGVSAVKPLDDAHDNIFRFDIPEVEKNSFKAYLSYELYGLNNNTGVPTMVNHHFAFGGYMIKKEESWSSHREEINIKWLKKGENTIMFSTLREVGLSYQIKNVKIEFEKLEPNTVLSPIVVNTPDIRLFKDNKVYVKGFIRKNETAGIRVFAENEALTITDGVFEGFISLTEDIKKKQFIILQASDSGGFLGQEIIFLNALNEADKLISIENISEYKSTEFTKSTPGSVSVQGAKITVAEESLLDNTTLSIAKLRSVDIAPLNSGMINVTKGGIAYRFLPDGIKFNKPVKIELEYDKALLPPGYTADDIKTFYFDTNRKSWVAVQRDTIAANGNMIASLTTHFSDYINGVIQTPESPETAGFTPTMMNDVQAADPSAEMTIISPPEASQKGGANVSYPIKIPAGRNGMQPQLAVQYNSDAGSGWLGLGWDINIPSLSIDTRWGTPQLDPVNESEMYLLNGEQLMYPDLNDKDWMPNRHYVVSASSTVYSTQTRPRISNAVFTPRKQGSFAKIERLGSNTTNYYWKVTTTDGTIHWYGGKLGVVDTAVIKNDGGHVVHWGLYMSEDVHGNQVLYEYTNTAMPTQSGVNANLTGGKVFRINKIKYTGYNGNDYGYEVEFVSAINSIRNDANISARLGIKQVDANFLNSIIVRKTGSSAQIRKYNFTYDYGKFKKSRLKAVAELDKNNVEFYKHTFEYYDDLAQGDTDVWFGSVVTETLCNELPEAPCQDTDGDGVCDNQDLCPDESGPASNSGCPEKCTSIEVSTSQLFMYSLYYLLYGSYPLAGPSCRPTCFKLNKYIINNQDFSALSYNIFTTHGAGNDYTVSRCPYVSLPLTATHDYGVQNPDGEARFLDFQSDFFIANNIQAYNQSHIFSGYVYKSSLNQCVNEGRVVPQFYSPQDINLTGVYQFVGPNQGIDWYLSDEVEFIFDKYPITSSVANIFINNSAVSFGTFSFSNFVEFSAFASLLSTTYPGTTATISYPASGNPIINITTSNSGLNFITFVHGNISNTYNFTACNVGMRPIPVLAKNDLEFKLSENEIEYTINSWLASGEELKLPIKSASPFQFENESVQDIYILCEEENLHIWQYKNTAIIQDQNLIKKLDALVNIENGNSSYFKKHKEDELAIRKSDQNKAIKWLEDFRKTFDAANQSNITPKSTPTGNTNYYQQLFNNYIVAFNSQTTGDPDCPTFINSAFIVQGQIPSFVSAGAILGSSHSENFNVGGHFGVGVDFSWDPTSKNITVGGGYNYSTDNSESLTALVDLNGDGLDDLVYKHNGWIYWRKHTVTRSYDSSNEPIITHEFEGFLPITSYQNKVTNFYRSNGTTSSWNTQVNFGFSGGGAFAGYESSTHNSRTNIYFTDANADGLMDIVKYGTVYFNRTDNGTQYFEPQSLDTENMLIVAAPVTVALPPEQVDTHTPKYDVVKVWEAPADGTIKIENTIVSTDTSRETVVTIESPMKGCYSADFTIPTDTVYKYGLNKTLIVNANHSACYVTSYRFNSLTINNQTYNAIPNNIFFIHGDNSDPAVNRCPATPLTTFQDPIVKNPFCDAKMYSFLNTQFGSLNIPVYNLSINNLAYVCLDSNGHTDSYVHAGFEFYSTQNLVMSCKTQSGGAGYPGFWATIYNEPIQQLSSASVSVNLIISVNGIPMPGTYNLPNNFNSFKTAFEALYPGSTVTLIPASGSVPASISVSTSNSNINTITIGHSSGYSQIYNFNPCVNNPVNTFRPLSKGTSKIIPTKEEVEFAINTWKAEGNELQEPLSAFARISNIIIPEKESNQEKVYSYTITEGNIVWKDSNGLIIKEEQQLQYLKSLLPENISEIYHQEEDLYKQQEIKRREEARDIAISNLKSIETLQNFTPKNGPSSCELSVGENCLLFGTKLNATTPSVTNVITTMSTDCVPGGGTLTVKKGDRIYFRVHSVPNGNPAVEWDPKVSYTNAAMLAINDQNALPVYSSSYSDGFILSQNVPVIFPGNGNANVTWEPFTVSNPTDDVTYKIVKRIANGTTFTDTVIFEKLCLANTVTSVAPTGLNNISVSGTTASQVTQFLFQVTATSNVKWKAVEWLPKMICITGQPVVATQNGPSEGTLTTGETKYPIVDYSIYKPYQCAVPYTTINISQMNGGSGLSIVPDLTNNLFASTDNGVLYFVVKRGNQFIGRRIINVVGGSVSMTGGAIPITGSGATIEVGFYTDDSKRTINSPTDVSLHERLLNDPVIAKITGTSTNYNVSPSQVNFYHEEISMVGSMYRQWGQFMYNPSAATGATSIPSLGVNLLKVQSLGITDAQATAIHDALLDGNNNINADLTALQNFDVNSPNAAANMQAAMQNISNNAGLNNMPFMTANPYRDYENGAFTDRWIGMHPECYSNATGARAALLSQVFSFEDDGDTSQAGLNTGAFGIDKYTEGSGESISGGGGFGGFGASGTTSLGGYSNALTDYIDLNGDSYPDIVTVNETQFTLKTGGLFTPTSRGSYGGNMSEDQNGNWGFSASGTFSKSGKPASGGDGIKIPANGKLKIGKPGISVFGGGNNSMGISGNFGSGNNKTSRIWADINGDGLPDVLTKNGSTVSVNLNMGTTPSAGNHISTFNANNYWGNFEFATGKSTTIGGGAGFNYANESISAGISLGSTDADTENTLIDFNGDGLLDKVSSSSSSISVDYNCGNRFIGSPVTIDSHSLYNSACTTTAGLNGTGTYSMIWPLYLIYWVIPLKIPDVSVTVAGGTSTNRTKKSIVDFDGDGYPDIVKEINATTVEVFHSRIRRTNKLKSVTNPLGGKFTIDYEVQPVGYGNPSAKWTMKSVVLEDSYDKVNDGTDVYYQEFIYEKGKYDRREREFYGYETVKTIEYLNDTDGEPSAVYRTAVSVYHNNSYFLNGLLKETYSLKGSDNNAIYTKTINTYEIKELSNNNSEIVPSSSLPETFDVGGREGRRTAAVVLAKTVTELYELESSPQIVAEVEMVYDNKGRIETYVYSGDLSTNNDDYKTTITYHDLANNIINVPSEMRVFANGGQVRRRETTVIPSTGQIQEIKAYLDSSTFALTTMQYDGYGNLERIDFPQNDNGESMFKKYVYDPNYHKYVVSIEDAYGYTSYAEYNSDFDKIIMTKDKAENQMLYEYDSFGRNTIIRGPKEIEQGKPYTIKFSYYPKFSSLPSGTAVTESTFVPVALTQHYDVKHSGNDIETITFIDGLGRPIQIKKDITLNKSVDHESQEYYEAMSVSGKACYDEFGRTIRQYHPYYETKSGTSKFLLNEYNSTINPTITNYDEVNRPVQTLDPDQNISTMEYSLEQDVNGTMAVKIKAVIAQNGNTDIITESYNDVSGRAISAMNMGPQGEIWTQFKYNAIGELLEYKDDEGLIATYKYDGLGRKIEKTHPDNGTTLFNYDLSGNMTQMQTANLAQVGSQIKYHYEFNRLVFIQYPDNPDGSQNISNVTYKYGLPGSGNQTGRLIYQEDATGSQEFEYGNMGEVIYNRRIVVGPTPSMPVRAFKTFFEYDSFNRLLQLIYPDGENVTFDYDLGGNLNKMTGEFNSAPYNYISRLDYDHYEQRAFILYGNNTKTYYGYSDSMRRTNSLKVKTSDGHDLLDNMYEYDYAGNIIGVQNVAGITANDMGGGYNHTFEYDNLNRLGRAYGNFTGSSSQQQMGNDYQSEYNLDMKYNSTHSIILKRQAHTKNNATVSVNTYENTYQYYENSHKLKMVTDGSSNLQEEFKYDDNGNLTDRFDNQGNSRDMYWDEANRLRVVHDENAGDLQHYIYDAGGNRVLKANSDVQQTYQNGTIVDPGIITINNYTTYASGYLVIDGYGVYSKHYYAGAQRIVSRIGDQNYDYFDMQTLTGGRGTLPEPAEKQQAQVKDLNNILEKAGLGKARFKEFKPYTYEEIQLELEEEALDNTEADTDNAMTAFMAPPEGLIYYYHPDHLGTSTFLTDFNGNAYQFFLNLPFGETMAEQLPSGYYQTPYKFNGKELDAETGMYYYGARYYDPRVSIWMSVDPLAEETMTPYQYCTNNPINFIDPDGRKEYPNSYQGELGKGDWREDDRINGTDVWNKANLYNLQQQKGYQEYTTIEQRAQFYKWFQHYTDSRGYETNWAGAAHIVALQMANVHGPFTFTIDNDVEDDIVKFAEAGNKAIFENVFARLRDLSNGSILKGEAANAWDTETLTIEQRDIVGPIYNKQRPAVLNELSKMAKGEGKYEYGVPKNLRFDPKGNIRDWRQRFKHGMNVSLSWWNKYYSKRKKK